MTIAELFVYAVAILGIVFLVCGLVMLVIEFKKVSPTSKPRKFEFSLIPPSFSGPYLSSIFVCVIGLFLLFLAYNVVTKGGVPERQSSNLLISSAYAQGADREADSSIGWVYFGPEGRPEKWNFEIVGGGYRDFQEEKPGVVLKALRSVNLREDHFGNFTGTILGFLSPEPPVLGTIAKGACIRPEEIVSVGFSKIWIKARPAVCPQ